VGENGQWSPWRHLREQHPNITVYEYDLPGAYLGCVDHDKGLIYLDSRLNQAERRCTLAHEIGHLERGPVPPAPLAAIREELEVDRWAADKLIRAQDLIDVFRWTSNLSEAAEELWVDQHMLLARLRYLTAADRALLKVHLGHVNEVA
jgi:Zn-dependent peptidase ImmA (M78 family)